MKEICYTVITDSIADFYFAQKEDFMLRTLLQNDIETKESAKKEGELFRSVTTYGKTFELRYGYYGEKDRENPLCEPVPIYPDFVREPIYTDEGKPFVTMMQDACENYKGSARRSPDTTCAECRYFERGEEWFGVCKCPHKRERKNE